MAAPYLDATTLPAYSAMPSTDIADLDATEPGFIAARLAVWSSRIHARIGKRYVRPFVSPVPPTVLGWLGACVTVDMYLKRGTNPQDTTLEQIQKDKADALGEMKEAADAVEGLFDIPLDAGADGSAITKGEPLASSDCSPWDWMDQQAERAGR